MRSGLTPSRTMSTSRELFATEESSSAYSPQARDQPGAPATGATRGGGGVGVASPACVGVDGASPGVSITTGAGLASSAADRRTTKHDSHTASRVKTNELRNIDRSFNGFVCECL